ncbi:helix-turn-helix domain-containing protein [Georgfuchsia toluolica]|nr:helix-turn-helix domain-containing protein [Georgfuchsia toluolica]
MATPFAVEDQQLGQRLDDVSNAVVRVHAQKNAGLFDHYAVSYVKLATLTIHRIESDPVTVSRLDEDILADHVFDLLLHVQIEGTAVITQGEKIFTLERDSIAIVPGGIPYSVNYPERGSKIILRIPHRVFHERVLGREVRDFGATLFSGGGLVPVIINLLKSLTQDERKELTEIEQFTLADSFLALVGAVVRSRSKCGVDESERNHSARLCRILSYLEENFSDHELTPTRIADANFVSVRHLHGLFKQCGTTVSKWIWDRRLKAGREDLLDPSMASLTICEIAYRRGFNDSAHFSRAFKDRFGISPGQLRTKSSKG